MKNLFRVLAYVRRYRSLALGMLACAAGATLLVAVFPAVTQLVIDRAVRGNQPDLLLPLCLVGLLGFLLQNGLNSLRIILNNSFEQKVIFDLRSDLYSHLQRLPAGWFDNRATGDIMTRVLEDVSSMERVLIDGIETGLIAVLQITVVLGMLFFYHAGLAWAALAPIPFLALGAWLYTSTAYKRYRAQRQASSAMNSLLLDNLGGIRQIKTYVREEAEHARFNDVSDRLRSATLWVMHVWARYSPSMDFLAGAGLVLVTFLGGRAVLRNEMQLGELVAVLALVKFLYDPVAKLHTLNQMFQAGRAASARVFEILDTPVEPGHAAELPIADCRLPIDSRVTGAPRSGAPSPSVPADEECTPPLDPALELRDPQLEVAPTSAEDDAAASPVPSGALAASPNRQSAIGNRQLSGSVEFRDVSFSYEGRHGVLQHITLSARPGETVALVGATGAGKSTLVNLLPRFYEFDAGEILLDGQPLRSLPLDYVRRNVGVVTQESFLFNGTVRDNLRFARPEATDEELLEACAAAGARDFIERLPEQLGTVVGERGVKLSVGEKQRVSIARALLKDPPILVLDEATASVDNETERLIQAALEKLMSRRTSFVIAHRLSTVRNADQILVLDRGRIVERGRHEELLTTGGRYAKLYAASMHREEDEALAETMTAG